MRSQIERCLPGFGTSVETFEVRLAGPSPPQQPPVVNPFSPSIPRTATTGHEGSVASFDCLPKQWGRKLAPKFLFVKRVIVSCERASPARAVDSGSVARKQLFCS